MGLLVRQWPEPAWKTAAKLAVVNAGLLAALVGLNQVRLDYLRVQNAPTTHSEAFFLVNLLVLMAAAIVTYLSHDPEAGFAEAKANLEKCEHKIQKLKGGLAECENKLRAEVGMLYEAGGQAISYYRMHNRRKRQDVPHYFDDPNDPNHKPHFDGVVLPGEQSLGRSSTLQLAPPLLLALGDPK